MKLTNKNGDFPWDTNGYIYIWLYGYTVNNLWSTIYNLWLTIVVNGYIYIYALWL